MCFWRAEEALNPLQQEFQEAVSHPVLVLGTKLRPSTKAAMLLTVEPSLLTLKNMSSLVVLGMRDAQWVR